MNRAILTLPTGAGKTRTAVEAIVEAICQAQFSGRFVLWVAQSDELCEQAVEAVREVWTHRSVRIINDARGQRGRPLRVFRLWGTRAVPDPSDSGIIVASIQKLTDVRYGRHDSAFGYKLASSSCNEPSQAGITFSGWSVLAFLTTASYESLGREALPRGCPRRLFQGDRDA